MFRRRQQGGGSVVFLIFGVMGLLMSCGGLFFGVPAGIFRAREVRNLPQPTAAELDSIAAGTTVIIAAQIPSGAPTTDGLALFYMEERLTGTRESSNEESVSAGDRDWVRIEGTDSLVLVLSDGREVDVQFPHATSFMNVQEGDAEAIDGGVRERRTSGYLPGQTLALEGSWEGNDLLTAKTVYAGTIDDFVSNVRRSPFAILAFSLVCLVISFVLIGVGGFFRILRR